MWDRSHQRLNVFQMSIRATKIASQKPSIVIITLNDAAAANIILQARQAGVGKEVQFVSNNATAQPSFIKIGGKAVEGVQVSAGPGQSAGLGRRRRRTSSRSCPNPQ